MALNFLHLNDLLTAAKFCKTLTSRKSIIQPTSKNGFSHGISLASFHFKLFFSKIDVLKNCAYYEMIYLQFCLNSFYGSKLPSKAILRNSKVNLDLERKLKYYNLGI